MFYQVLPVHKHENSTLAMHVLSGSGELKINYETVAIKKVLTVKGEDDFSIPDANEDVSLFVTLRPNPSNELYAKSFG